MKKSTVVFNLFLLVFFGWSLYLHLVDADRPDAEFLAKDVYFRLNDLVISVPVVAVKDLTVAPGNSNPLPKFRTDPRFFGTSREFATRAYKIAMLEFAGDPSRPAPLSQIRLGFGVYMTYGEQLISGKICSLLSREWSRKACRNQLRNEFENLPKSIYLVTEYGLELFAQSAFFGVHKETLGYLIDKKRPIGDQAKVVCTDGQTHCYATLMIAGEIFAVWSFDCAGMQADACEHKFAAEGDEIREFVTNKLRAY